MALSPAERARSSMWQNFLAACQLGAVVVAHDQVVWQKRAAGVWQRVGSASEYSPDSIAWPVQRIFEGVE
jgi:hypothetical protein